MEFKAAIAIAVNFIRGRVCAANKVGLMLIQRINERNEALGFIAIFSGHFWNIREKERVELGSEGSIIICAKGGAA